MYINIEDMTEFEIDIEYKVVKNFILVTRCIRFNSQSRI